MSEPSSAKRTLSFAHPTLIILGGFAGVGKSTIAKRLSIEFSIPWFSTDLIAKTLQSSLQKGFHEVAPTAYDIAFDLIHTHLENGITIILDTNMCHARSWESVDQLIVRLPHARCIPIILESPLATLEKRIADRGEREPDHLNLGGDQLKDVLHKYIFIQNLQRTGLRRVDANQSREDVYEGVVTILHSCTNSM